MTQLSLCLFGTPQIEHGEAPVKLSSRKPLALLAYLGVMGTPHTREHLATLLWPDAEQNRAYAYLRNALWQLNQTPVSAWIESDHDTIALRQGNDLYLDVAYFQRQLAACKAHGHASGDVCSACVVPLTEAAATYRGDFMTGVTLEDSAAYDEWQFFQTQSLRQAATDTLEKLTRYYGQQSQDQADKAIDFARRWLAIDPQNETAHCELMRLYTITDQRAAALRQYDACLRALKEGLGAAPSKATVDLYRRIRSGELAAPAAAAPPVRSIPERRPAPRLQLPTPATPFVGREEEVAEVSRLLMQPGCRLLSLVGPGGIGKTRLAWEAAHRISEESGLAFADGIVAVPLASVSTPEAVLREITAALALSPARQGSEHLDLARDPARRSPAGSAGAPDMRLGLLDYLRDRSMLMILDNLEHLISGGAQSGIADLVEAMLQTAPGVRLLVTTRERLNLLTEWVFVVTGMALPTGDVASWAESGAIQLFIQSAQRAMVGFTPTPEELSSIAVICRLVEGFPLAIELAASWVRALPCQEIAGEVRASFDFLSSSLRDVPERHRSLRTIFEHSWTLLPQAEADAFARLAIFRGGFTREAAREITGTSLMTLSSLMDKSLLQPAAQGSRPAAGRYEMHSVLRQYAEAKLRLMPGAGEDVAMRHAHYYLALLAALEPALKRGDQVQALDTIAVELPNMRSAWLWAVEHRAVAELLPAVVPLHLACNLRGQFQEAVALFNAAIDALTPLPTGLATSTDRDHRTLLGLLLVLVELHARASTSTPPQATAARGIAILEALGPSAELALATVLAIAMGSPDLSEPDRRLRETLKFYEEHDDTGGRANTLRQLGTLVAHRRDDYVEGEAYLEHGLRLHREIHDLAGIAGDLMVLGTISDSRGMTELAEQRYREALALYQDLGNPWLPLQCLRRLGDLARRSGDAVKAEALLHEALDIARDLGDQRSVAYALNNLWMAVYDKQAYGEAQQYALEEIAIWQRMGGVTGVAGAQQRLADALMALGELAMARHYLKESLSALPDNIWGLLGLARIAEIEGDEATAFQTYCQAILLAQRTGGLGSFPSVPATFKGMVGLSRLYARLGNPERAAELLGMVLYQPTLHDAMRSEAEALLVSLLAHDPDGALDAARLRGETLDPDAVASGLTSGVAPFSPDTL